MHVSSMYCSLHFYTACTKTLLEMASDVSCFIILLIKDVCSFVIEHVSRIISECVLRIVRYGFRKNGFSNHSFVYNTPQVNCNIM
jgi:hypothetical protein